MIFILKRVVVDTATLFIAFMVNSSGNTANPSTIAREYEKYQGLHFYEINRNIINSKNQYY